MKTIIMIVSLIVIPIITTGQNSEAVKRTFIDQPFQIHLDDKNQDQAERVEQKCWDKIQAIEKNFSSVIQGSIVNRLNQYAGRRPVQVDPEMIDLLIWSEQLAETTRGTFDITTASFLWHYGFGQKDFRVPLFLTLDSVKPLVNHKLIFIDEKDHTVLFKRDGVQIDMDTMLTSYAFNQLYPIIKKNKIDRGRVLIGQSILVVGKNHTINHQLISTWQPKQPLLTVTLKQGQLLVYDTTTQSFQQEGKHYHKLVDPKTGLPYYLGKMAVVYQHNLKKKAIPPAVLLTRQPARSISWMDQMKDSACLIVDQNNQLHFSKKWDQLISR